jgi:hypothetical protein
MDVPNVRALLLQQYAANARARDDAYDAGYAAGLAAGRLQAEQDMDTAWATLGQTIRRTAAGLRRPVPEPAERAHHDDSIWFTAHEQERLGILPRRVPSTGINVQE